MTYFSIYVSNWIFLCNISSCIYIYTLSLFNLFICLWVFSSLLLHVLLEQKNEKIRQPVNTGKNVVQIQFYWYRKENFSIHGNSSLESKRISKEGLKRDFITFYDCSLYEQERTHYCRSFSFGNVIRAGKMRFIVKTRLDDVSQQKGFS